MLVKEIIEGYNESISFENQIGTFTISPNRVKYTLLRNKYYHIAKEVYNLMTLLKCFICNFSFIEEPPCN